MFRRGHVMFAFDENKSILIKPAVIPANKCRVHIIPMYNVILLAIRQDSICFLV